jgi:hypothetical protein
LAALRDERRPMLIPIYDGVTGNGASTTYHLAGFASFVLAGYYQSGFTAPSRLTGHPVPADGAGAGRPGP